VSIPALRMENDQTETELNALRNVMCGRFLAQQKSDAERAYQKMSAEEKVAFKQKMAVIDEAGGESPPTSLTPV